MLRTVPIAYSFQNVWQCLGLILEEAICGQCGTEVHEEVGYGAMK